VDTSKHIGIWLRVSTEDQVRGESLDVHESRARSYAESKGWTIAETYRLEAVSGKSVINHPEARRMLSDVARGHITGLIFSKLARLSRNNRELLDFAEVFQNHKADLISLAENIDTSSPAGRMFFNMLAAMANWEREEIASRVAASVPVRAKMGRPMGGQAQYGYAWVGKEFVIVPEEAAVRKLMYELFLEHRRFRTVARILNERGYRTRHNAKWAGGTIERLMRDPTAKGQKRFNYTKSMGRGETWVHKPEEEWVIHPCPPIVSTELWNSVNDLLVEKKLAGIRQSRVGKTLFGGLCFCHCGGRMYVPSKMHKYVCEQKGCRHKIETDTLEAIFQSELDTFAFAPETLDENKQRISVALGETSALIESHQETIKHSDAQIDQLLGLHQSGSIDQEGFRKRYEPLGIRNRELQAELPRLEEKKRRLLHRLNRNSEALAETKDVALRYETMPFVERRRLVESVVERVSIGHGEVEFSYLFDPRHGYH
jgi:site-specific DNA recombinase